MATGALSVGPKPPEVTDADRRAVRRQHLGALAHRRAPGGANADAQPLRAVRQLLQDAFRAGEVSVLAPRLADGEGEVRLDRRGGLVEVVPVERQPGLEPERIARAEPDGLHLGLRQQRAGERLGMLGRDGNLEAVLAGIAGARDMAVDAVEFCARRAHEAERLRAWAMVPHQCRGRGALQRQQRPVLGGLKRHAGGQMRADMRVVDVLARRVEDQAERAVAVLRERSASPSGRR